jgi:hypothetical protein
MTAHRLGCDAPGYGLRSAATRTYPWRSQARGLPIHRVMKIGKAAATLSIALLAGLSPPSSQAQKYPEKNVRLIVPFP